MAFETRVSFDDNQEAGINWALNKVNEARAAEPVAEGDVALVPMTIEEFVQQFNGNVADSYFKQSGAGDVEVIKAALEVADPNTRDQVKVLLGI